MAFDIGGPQAVAQLDTAPFEKAAGRLEQLADQLDKRLAQPLVSRPIVDPTRAQQGAAQVQQAVEKAVQAGQKVPPIRPRFDLSSLQDGLRRLQGQLGGAAKELGTFDGAAGRMVGLGLGAAAVAALGKALFDLGARFDAAADAIRIGTGATAEALADLEGAFLKTFGSIPADAAAVAAAISILNTRLGLTGDALAAVTGDIAELARLTGSDVVATARGAAKAFAAWGVETDDMRGKLDEFLRTTQATDISLVPLLESLASAAPVLKTFGFSLTEAEALLGALEKQGIDSGSVIQSLQQAFRRFVEAGLSPKAAFADLLEVIRALPDEQEAMRLAVEAFGRSAPRVFDAIRTGKLDVAELTQTIAAGSETIQQAADDTNDAAERWKVGLNRFQGALKPVADAMFKWAAVTLGDLERIGEAIDAFIARVTPGLTKVAQLMAQLQGAEPPAAGSGATGAKPVDVSEDDRQAILALLPPLQAVGAAAEAVAVEVAGIGDAGAAAGASIEERAAAMAAAFREPADKAKSLQEQLAALGSDQAAIAALLDYQRALGIVEQAIRTLDPVIAAEIVALQTAARATEDAGEGHRLLADAAQVATERLAEHKAQQDAIREAAREHERALRELEQAQKKVAEEARKAAEEAERFAIKLANLPVDMIASRLDRLAQATFPQLTAAQQAHVQQLQLLAQRYAEQGDQVEALRLREDALRFAVEATGGSYDAARAAAEARGTALDAEIARLGELAQAEQRAAAARNQFAEAARRNAEIFQATGRLPAAPTPPTDAFEQFAAEVGKLREALTRELAQLNQQLQKIAEQWQQVQQRFKIAVDEAGKTLAETLADIDEQEEAAVKALQAQDTAIRAEMLRRLAEIAQRMHEALATFEREQAERAEALGTRQREMLEGLAKAAQRASESVARAVEDATKRQREQLLALGQQMTRLREQEARAQFDMSARLADLTAREFAAMTGEERSALAQERIRLEAERGAAQVAAARALQDAQAQAREQAEAAREGIERMVAESQRAQAEQRQALEEQFRKMREQAAKEGALAAERLAAQLKALEAQKHAVIQQAFERRVQVAQQIEAIKAEARKRRQQAQRQYEERVKAAQAAKQQAEEELRRQEEQVRQARADAERRFFAERAQRQELLDAAIKQLRYLDAADTKLANIEAKLGVTQEVDLSHSVIQEMAIDGLAEWTTALRRRLVAGNVG